MSVKVIFSNTAKNIKNTTLYLHHYSEIIFINYKRVLFFIKSENSYCKMGENILKFR